MSHPTISVSITIAPGSVTLGAPCLLTISATLSHSTPITIYTWPSAFNLDLSQRRKNFFCVDLSDNGAPVNLESTKGGKRSGYINRELGGRHDQFFRTLEPGQPANFTAPFISTTRLNNPLLAGHRYRFGLREGESIGYWLKGTREEVMSPPGEDVPFGEGCTPKIVLDVGGPVEFEVFES